MIDLEAMVREVRRARSPLHMDIARAVYRTALEDILDESAPRKPKGWSLSLAFRNYIQSRIEALKPLATKDNWDNDKQQPKPLAAQLKARVAALESQIDLDRKHIDSQARVYKTARKRINELESQLRAVLDDMRLIEKAAVGPMPQYQLLRAIKTLAPQTKAREVLDNG